MINLSESFYELFLGTQLLGLFATQGLAEAAAIANGAGIYSIIPVASLLTPGTPVAYTVSTTAPPPPAAADIVLSNGLLNKTYWPADWSYGGLTPTYGFTNPVDGAACLKLASNPEGGGWLPFYQPNPAVPAGGYTPNKFLNLEMMATWVDQQWLIAVEGTGDVVIPGSNVFNFSADASGALVTNAPPGPVINTWVKYKIPVSAMNLGTATIEKFGVQDQIMWGPINNKNPGNVWYVKNAFFSAT
jgi:hypothetical protein